MTFNPNTLPPKVLSQYKRGPIAWMSVVNEAVIAGITDLDYLTSVLFYLHHPERNGRKIQSHETELIREWKGFREMIRPFLVNSANSHTTSLEGFVLEYSKKPARAVLADFDIDKATLKPYHQSWLNTNIIGPARAKMHVGGYWLINLEGHASRSGSNQHNFELSSKRINAVAAYLSSQLVGVLIKFSKIPLGEAFPLDLKQFENKLDRSVQVIATFLPGKVTKYSKPNIPLPKRTPRPYMPLQDVKVKNFTLQVLETEIYSDNVFGINVGPVGINANNTVVSMLIKIRELNSLDVAHYRFTGAGPGGSISTGITLPNGKSPASLGLSNPVYKNGKIHPFTTEILLDASDFEGLAHFNRFPSGFTTLIFGPKFGGFFSRQASIDGLDIGFRINPNPLNVFREFNTSGIMRLT